MLWISPGRYQKINFDNNTGENEKMLEFKIKTFFFQIQINILEYLNPEKSRKIHQ